VEGFRNIEGDFTEFSSWHVRHDWKIPRLPDFLQDVADQVPVMNVEFIGQNVIEVHLRPNPDFSGHRGEYLRVVKDFAKDTPEDGETFISDPCESRLGFWTKEPK
jgi:hypothetical protein